MMPDMEEVIDHQVSLKDYTSFAAMKVATAARNCYQSQKDMTLKDSEDFVRMLIGKGHESPLEFAGVTFHIITSRDISHELVRHRIASFAQESTRYVRYAKGIQFVRPVEFKEDSPEYYTWLNLMRDASVAYKMLLKQTNRPELARSVLPGSTKTSIYMHMNMRELRHFLMLRLSPAAHPDMQRVAQLCKQAVNAADSQLSVFIEGI